jgi:hypothetical protein
MVWVALLMTVSSQAADKGCGGCPIIEAAKSVNADKDSLAKITKLRDACIADMKKISSTDEFKKVSSGFKAAKDKSEKEAISKKLDEQYVPAFTTFHKGVNEVLGKDAYPKFVEKLPEYYKKGAVVASAEVKK